MPSPFRVHAALIAVSLLFGVNYVGTKCILAVMPAGAWVVFRMAAATAVLVPLAAWLARGRAWPTLATWPAIAFAALLGVAGNQVLFTEGLARTSPEHSAVVNACIPTWTMLLAVCVRQERLTSNRVLAVGCALAGVACLLGLDRLLFAPGDSDRASLLGDLLTVANGWSYAAYLVWLRRIGKQLDPYRTTALLFLFGTPMIAVWSADTVTAEHVHAVLAPPTVWLAAYAVLPATVLTYCLNTWALRHTHSSQVALYINLQPIVAAAVNLAIGGQPPGARFFGALGLVAFGLWLQARRPANG